MKSIPQISFRNFPESEALVNAISDRVDRLEHFFPRIIGCKVIVETPHRHHHRGNLVHIRIDLTVPGREIVINKEPGTNNAHKDAYVSIRDAFDAAGRKLQDYAREIRGDVKKKPLRQAMPVQGTI